MSFIAPPKHGFKHLTACQLILPQLDKTSKSYTSPHKLLAPAQRKTKPLIESATFLQKRHRFTRIFHLFRISSTAKILLPYSLQRLSNLPSNSKHLFCHKAHKEDYTSGFVTFTEISKCILPTT
jgi:hypothetical protein